MAKTRKELVAEIKTTTRETAIDTYINEYLNFTLQEINDPAWAYEQQGLRSYNHLWSFNRRKNTFPTVASTENYQLPRDVDKISLIRQTSSPTKLKYLPDDIFYRLEPNPTATGNPLYYRIWEEEGVSVRLSANGMLEVLSDTVDTQTIRIFGYDANGLPRTESLTLNGITAVSGTITYASGKPLRISKSGDTTGVISIREKTTPANILVKLAPTERMARFKVVSLYPIPSAAITIYLEYFTRIRLLEGDNDVPDIDEKWIWVLRLGAMAKVYQYQGKIELFNSTMAMYSAGVRSMVKADLQEPDYIPMFASHRNRTGVVTFSDEGYGSYGLI